MPVSAPPSKPSPVVLGRGDLGSEQIAEIATGGRAVRLAAEVLPRLERNHRAAVELATRTAVYGRSTAVGALLEQSIDDGTDAGRRLLHSHAATAGDPLPASAVRAMVAVRIEQIAAGASGLGPNTALALVDVLNADRMPVVGRYSSIGTGDIAALARLALVLPDGSLDNGDAMALMSSNALSVGRAALAVMELEQLLDAATAVTGLTFVARNGAGDALHPAAAGAFPGPQRVARALRGLGATSGSAARLQDQYGLRAAPQTLGVAFDAAGGLRSIVGSLTNSASENPLILTGPPAAAVHHGGFHTVHLTAALGAVRAAAVPAGLQTATVSRGVEHDAAFAPLSAEQLTEAIAACRVVVAAELVAAVRAIRIRTAALPAALQGVWEQCRVLTGDLVDRDVSEDLRLAELLLPGLAHFGRAAGNDEADPPPGRHHRPEPAERPAERTDPPDRGAP